MFIAYIFLAIFKIKNFELEFEFWNFYSDVSNINEKITNSSPPKRSFLTYFNKNVPLGHSDTDSRLCEAHFFQNVVIDYIFV